MVEISVFTHNLKTNVAKEMYPWKNRYNSHFDLDFRKKQFIKV